MQSFSNYYHTIGDDIRKMPKSLKIISLAFFIYYLAWGMIIPYMPIYFLSFTGDYAQVGYITGIMFLIISIASLVVGDLSDKIGRREIITFSFINYIIIGPMYAFAESIYILVIARVYNALVATGIWIPATAYIMDISPRHKEADYMGFFSAAYSASVVIGPLIAAVLVTFMPIKYLFLSLVVFSIIASLLSSKIPESVEKKEDLKDGISDMLFKDKVFMGELHDYKELKKTGINLTIISFIVRFTSAVLLMLLALVAKEKGVSLWEIGVIYSVFHLPFAMQFIFAEITDRIGKRKIVFISCILSALLFAALFRFENIYTQFYIVVLIAVSSALAAPAISAYLTEISKKNHGGMSGVFETIGSVSSFTGPVVAGILADLFGLGSAFLLCAAMLLISAGVSLKMPKSL